MSSKNHNNSNEKNPKYVKIIRISSLLFTGGGVGGIANGLAIWLFGILGINAALGVNLAPPLTPELLYSKIVWGGIWGFVFLFPIMYGSYFWRGVALSLLPTLVQLFIVFPFKMHKGMMGLQLGVLMPVLVVFYNAIWGVVTAYWLKFARK